MGRLICPIAAVLLLLTNSAAALIHYRAHSAIGQVASSVQHQQPFVQLPSQSMPEQTNPIQQQQQQQQQPSQASAAQQPDQQQQLPASVNNNNQLVIEPAPPLRSNSQRSIADGQMSPLPHPIFRFQGYALNSTSIKLIWNLNVSAPQPPEYFDIDYGPIPDATNLVSVTKLNKTTRDYTINQLTPDTPYQFMLKSSNRDQEFEPKLFVLRTPPTSANGGIKQAIVENAAIMPLGVKAESKSNNSIQLSWTEPPKPDNLYNSLRVNIIRYFVNPSQHSVPAPNSSPRSNDTTPAPVYHYLNVTNPRESRLIVQKLKPATEYAFAVKTAYWSPDMKKLFSQSGFSMDTIAKTYDLEPSAPRNFSIRVKPTEMVSAAKQGKAGGDLLAGDGSSKSVKTTSDITLEASWLPPESPNGQLRGYLILYANDLEPDNWSVINITDPKVDSWHVTGVAPGVTYYFKMRAINQRGQSQDSEVRRYTAPLAQGQLNPPIPPNNLLLLIIICMVAILFLLFLIVSRLACRTRSSSSGRKHRKGSLNPTAATNQKSNGAGTLQSGVPKLNGFASTNSSATVAARVGTLARRRTNTATNDGKPDFWINAMDQQQQNAELKSNISEKSNSELNMAMVSIQRDSPQFIATTQLAPTLPDYRQFAADSMQQQQQQQSHYHPGLQFAGQALGYDQMDNATASALMTLSKRQQQQMQKYQIQFAATGANGPPSSMTMGGPQQQQAPSPHQQPPPPPPLNIEQQQQQQQQQQQSHHHHLNQSLYGTHHHQPSTLASTRSLRLHQRTLYDPVSGSFLQSQDAGGPPNYSSHMHPMTMAGHQFNNPTPQQTNSNTLQFHPHQSNTLLSRRSTNTLRSFQTSQASALYGQLGAATGFAPPPPPNSIGGSIQQQQQPQQLLQSHQAVINQLNNSSYPSLPLKHVSAVRPQIMSSLEDQIEMELAEKEPTIGSQQSQDTQQQQQQHQPQQKLQ